MCYRCIILEIKNNNKKQWNTKFSHRCYYIQDIKHVQHKNVNMTWGFQKFPRHPVGAGKFEMRGRNSIVLHYHYSIYPELGKCVCNILWVLCSFTSCVYQLDKDWLTNIPPSFQPRYAHVENCYYNKIL